MVCCCCGSPREFCPDGIISKKNDVHCTYARIWIPYRPYLRIHQTSHMYTACFNYYCMNVTKVRYLSTVSLTQLDEIITFYSLYNNQSFFYHWHIKPTGPCYSSIMEIWHRRGETILYNSWRQSFVLF